MASNSAVRDIVAGSLSWSDAHVSFDDAVYNLPVHLRGTRAPGLRHSPWELVEHIRIVQRDILDFTIAEEYNQMEWPSGYWPSSAEPPIPEAWEESIATIREDRGRLQQLALDTMVDLAAIARHGTDQTYARELLLVVDHTAYHVGQLVLVRQLLGAWPAA